MALYNRLKEINSLVGTNLMRSSSLTLVQYYNSIEDKNSSAAFFTPFMIEAGATDEDITVGDILQRNKYFSALDRFLSKLQRNQSFSKLKNTNNKDVLFTEKGNVNLLLGDTDSYGYPGSTVLINMVEVNDNMTDDTNVTAPFDLFTRKYRLVGTVGCGEPAETAYIIPLGIISNDDLSENLTVRGGASNSSVSCDDTVFINVSTPLNNDSYVTNVSTGDYVSATNGFLSFDNTLTGPGDYYVFLTLSSSVAMTATVNLDEIIEVQSPAPTASVSFQTV